MKTIKSTTLSILLVSALLSLPVSAEFMGKGIACFPDCGEGAKAIELAQKGEYLVLAMDEDPANVAKAKKAAAEAGLLGRMLYVEQGAPDQIPFADHCVDLVVLDHIGVKDLKTSVESEIERVLTPIRGKVVLADDSRVKPELKGSDWWTHPMHAPNNNKASEDTVFQWPPLLQFRALPMSFSHNGSAMTAQGCHVEINGWSLKNPERAHVSGRIYVRNSYNGRLLWRDFTPKNIESDMPLYAIHDGKLYLGGGARAEAIVHDLFTGDKQQPVILDGEDRRIKWLAVADGTLFALIGDVADVRSPFLFALQNNVFGVHEKEHTLFGNEIVAWDLSSNKLRWKHTEPDLIDFRTCAVNDGHLYYYAEKKRLACLDTDTGNQVWENTDPSWIDPLKRPKKIHNHNVRHMSTLSADDGLVVFILLEGNYMCFFDEKTGQLLSQIEAGKRGATGAKNFILDGHYYRGISPVDLQISEQPAPELQTPAGLAWCGVATYAPGMGVIGHSTLGYKSPCGIGAWVAGGILIYSPTVCGCGSVQGAVGFASGGDIFERIQSNPEHPLIKGLAFDKISNQQSAISNAHDWPAYRGDSRHRGSSAVTVGAAVKELWTMKPERPFEYSMLYNALLDKFDDRPTPPTIVGDTIFQAGTDGIVHARHLADGKTKWTFSADGPVFTSPAYDKGRLYVPGMDGWVYALDAATGALAWKRRLAPVERRIHVFDQLMSAWPVMSLAVEDDTVYAAAGMFLINGSQAFALNAENGEMIWSKYFPPDIQGSHQPAKERVFGYGGHTAIAGDHVWMAGFDTMPLTLERKTGALFPLTEMFEKFRQGNTFRQIYSMQGQDVIVIDDRTVLAGGSHLLENQHLREGKRNRIEYTMYHLDENGAPDMEKAPPGIMKVARIAPACDDELLAFAAPAPDRKDGKGRIRDNYKMPMSTVGLNVWNKAKFVEEGRAMQVKPLIEPELRFGKPDYTKWTQVFRNLKYENAAWQKPDLDVNALAISADAVLAAHATKWTEYSRNIKPGEEHNPRIVYEGWQLTAFNRADGRELWKVDLPAEPLRNGISIAGDGTVIVAFRDGSLLAVGK